MTIILVAIEHKNRHCLENVKDMQTKISEPNVAIKAQIWYVGACGMKCQLEELQKNKAATENTFNTLINSITFLVYTKVHWNGINH